MLPLLDSLANWLDNGARAIGQIAILPGSAQPDTGTSAGAWRLCHQDDQPAALESPCGLQIHHGAAAARELAQYTDTGNYRPLRSAPDLRHGWLLELADLNALREALDYFYPAALGLWRAYLADALEPVTLRAKLQRQTGMYRSANRISDTRCQSLIRRVCDPTCQCAKLILWDISGTSKIHSLPPEKFPTPDLRACSGRIPLLCQEACNILVAEARVEARNEVIVVQE